VANTAAGSLRQRAASGGKWTAISAVAGIAIQLLQISALGRLLNPADFGLMAMMMVIIALANSIADFGFGNYLVQTENLSRQLLIRFFLLGSILAALLALTIALLADQVAIYYNSPALSSLLPWLALGVIVATVSQIQFAILQRYFKFQAIAIVEIIASLISLVVTVLLASFGYGVWSLVVGQIVLGSCKIIFYFWNTHQALSGLPKTCQTHLSDAIRFGSFQVAERFVNCLSQNLDKIVIGHLLGNAVLGIYSVAFQIMVRPYSALNPIFTRVSLPVFSHIKHDHKRLADAYLQILRIIALFSFPIYMGIAIASKAVVGLLLGSQWSSAAPILSILCFLGMLFSLGNPLGTLLVAKCKPAWGFYMNLICLFVYAIAFWVGSAFGLMGVALAFLLSAAIILYPIDFYVRWKLVGMTVREYFGAMKHLFIGLAIPIGIYAILLMNRITPQDKPTQILSAVLSIVIFFIYLSIFEKSLLKSTYNLVHHGK
jgi:lipopolysaccharide exporter